MLLLLGFFVVLPTVLFFALQWMARRWLRNSPNSPFAVKITRWGFLVYACMTLMLFYGAVEYHIRPDSAVGAFLHQPSGIVIGLVAVTLVGRWLDVLLRRAGRPVSIPRVVAANVPPSVILPPETPPLTLPDLVPPGFSCGVELLNDNLTPMEFVVSMLTSHLGLGRQEATRVMLEVHTKGGALIATPTEAAADAAAEAITREASSRGYPLVCRVAKIA